VRYSSLIGVVLAGIAAGGCAPPRAARPIPMAAFPAPDGLEGMQTRIPVDLDYAAGFVHFLSRSGITVREVTHVRPGDFFANAPRAVRLVTELGDAEVMFLPADALRRASDGEALGRDASMRPRWPVVSDTTPAPPRPLYFVARRDVFVVTGSVPLYDAIQRALRSDPIADS
jgi:hypothetical protein